MGEKRKTQPKEASVKKAKTQKPPKDSSSSSSSSGGSRVAGETGKAGIPYPKPNTGSSFTESTVRMTVTLAPMYSGDFLAGVHEALNNMLLHYVPQVRGVVLSYSKVKPRNDTALMVHDSPYGQLEISARLLLWRPMSGMTLKGQINVQSPDHIGMLLWDTFNASIPASFIPKDKYEWRPFNDDEIAARALPANQTDTAGADEEQEGKGDADVPSSPHQGCFKYGSGEWVAIGTSQCVGTDSFLEFVIVDVIRANEVLSVTGALR
ncbi:hypothetical protein GGI04_001220 [Coemansia thaxteri]|nr:hypothetical protein GGI04_001220 [Coemansia thaxteri]KAJ2335392.1 hypothetical protein GGH92_008039 [Coemansia sp. RSA 2673]KAJ2473318.1 hypothetical protein GGI02_000941 [Coemansia sp. RSA 2322]